MLVGNSLYLDFAISALNYIIGTGRIISTIMIHINPRINPIIIGQSQIIGVFTDTYMYRCLFRLAVFHAFTGQVHKTKGIIVMSPIEILSYTRSIHISHGKIAGN